MIKLDDVRFVPFKEKQTTLLTCKGTHFKYRPYSYQIDGIDYGLNHKGWLLLDDQGLGKLEPVSANIPTPSGFKKMGDIVEGDKVFGSDGKPCNVLKVFPHKNKDIYKVRFNDGTFAECGLEHLWIVRTPTMRTRGKGWVVKSTEELLKSGLQINDSYREKLGYKKRNKWEIPVTEPVEYNEKPFVIDPYILGMCIGDGNLCNGRVAISIPDFEIESVSRVSNLLHTDYTLHKHDTGSCPQYYIVSKVHAHQNLYISEFNRLGLCVKSSDKFIPSEYMFGSVSQRKELFRGLMDADGHIASKNRVSYATSSSRLADDVCELVCSLGGISKKHQYTRKNGKVDYVVSINVMFNPFNLKRKSDRYTKTTNRCCTRYIESIELDRKEDAQCLMVDSFNHSYLTGNRYIVTHNTLQMIYLAEVLKKKENLKHCLVVCGVNTLKFNWASEIEKLSNLDYKILGTRVRKNGTQYIGSVQDRLDDLQKPLKEFFAITNIETLQDKKFAEAFKKSKNKFDLIVLDEAHRVKNPSAKATKTLLKLSAPRKIALTGTLIMNNPENAYVALKWTGNLGCTYSNFNAMYNVYGGFGGVQVISHKNLDLLQEHIASCSLRRKKEDVLDLPPKTYQKEYVELLPEQRKLYNDVLKQITEELDNLSKRQKITIQEEMVMNMRLRQITAYPGILSSTITQSAKLDRLEEIVEDVASQGDKVLVFCSFKSTAPEIKQRLAQYNPLVCTGNTPDFEINDNKKRFQENPDNKVMICTWQKMGTGHTLTAANYVIFIDTPWTDADFQQSADRAYRIGQTKHTHIITLICKDTYDERVQEILDRKEMLSSYLIDKADNSLFQCSDFDEFD